MPFHILQIKTKFDRSEQRSEIMNVSHQSVDAMNEWITLNVGGQIFMTSRSTLVLREPSCMLSRMFSGSEEGMMPSIRDNTGAFLIDRSPKYFDPILNYLRTGNLIIDPSISPEGVLEEARYYGIDSIIPRLESMSRTSILPRE